jgi:uncharacterized protein
LVFVRQFLQLCPGKSRSILTSKYLPYIKAPVLLLQLKNLFLIKLKNGDWYKGYEIYYICGMNPIELNKDKLYELCDTHKVKELYLFGSILTDKFNDSSDIDMLIQFSQVELLEYFDNYMDLKEKLEQLFLRPVDLLENQAIRNPIFRKVIEKEKQLVYERKIA